MEHIDAAEPEWRPITKAGEYQVEELRLNAPDQIRRRVDRSALIRVRKHCRSLLADLKVRNNPSYRDEIGSLEEQIEALNRKIDLPPIDYPILI
jgi:hypothetical protein